MTDLRTPLQIARAKRAEKVCALYRKLKEGKAQGSTTAIASHIADTLTQKGEYITPMGVRHILKTRELI